MWAAYRCRSSDPLHLLCSLGADVTMRDFNHGNTALHWAILQQDVLAVRNLIKFGSRLDVGNKEVRLSMRSTSCDCFCLDGCRFIFILYSIRVVYSLRWKLFWIISDCSFQRHTPVDLATISGHKAILQEVRVAAIRAGVLPASWCTRLKYSTVRELKVFQLCSTSFYLDVCGLLQLL